MLALHSGPVLDRGAWFMSSGSEQNLVYVKNLKIISYSSLCVSEHSELVFLCGPVCFMFRYFLEMGYSSDPQALRNVPSHPPSQSRHTGDFSSVQTLPPIQPLPPWASPPNRTIQISTFLCAPSWIKSCALAGQSSPCFMNRANSALQPPCLPQPQTPFLQYNWLLF